MSKVTDERQNAERGVIAFIVTEDWFFVSHFLPMVNAARKAGLKSVVVTRVRNHSAAIENAGARVITLDIERNDFRRNAISASVGKLTKILKQEQPAIVHCISLRSIIIGGLAARMAGIKHVIFALTGLGMFGARTDIYARIFRRAARTTVRQMIATRNTRFVFENLADAKFLGLYGNSQQAIILGGSGVDPDMYPLTPLPKQPPLRIAVVARMLWSKGIDTAVDAVCLARKRGVDVTLSLYGNPDTSNPRAISIKQLERWSEYEFVHWHGHTNDVASVWATHHIACLPSRGGEGLPRTLLEAAACGRPILTTDVPGCHDFVRDQRDGFVLPVDDPPAFADAIISLTLDPEKVALMGQEARARVFEGYTTDSIINAMVSLYSDILQI